MLRAPLPCQNLLSPLVTVASSWVAFTSDHSSLVTLRLFFCKKLLLRPCLSSSPQGLSLLSFVYRLLDLSSAHLTSTKRVLLLLPNLQDDHYSHSNSSCSNLAYLQLWLAKIHQQLIGLVPPGDVDLLRHLHTVILENFNFS
ncbi:hypothetical protein B296_00017650 [Ensete ventricosum]|uniref:Uncharacterized protein n=1 Tax=Ensete ventricosum TaxID=4639 RepID=A0A426Z9C6_ENSVE|nr:hypothetical protein B296_00017650 [Ensete ventricosum]